MIFGPLPAAQNTERAEKGDTEILLGGASHPQKLPCQAIVRCFPGAKAPPKTLSNQNLSVSPCHRFLRVWRRRPIPQEKTAFGTTVRPAGGKWKDKRTGRLAIRDKTKLRTANDIVPDTWIHVLARSRRPHSLFSRPRARNAA